MQSRSPEERRARTIAANNIVNALFMVAGALGASALLQAGVSIPRLFVYAAVANALVALALCLWWPEFGRRFVAWMRERRGGAR